MGDVVPKSHGIPLSLSLPLSTVVDCITLTMFFTPLGQLLLFAPTFPTPCALSHFTQHAKGRKLPIKPLD